MENIIGMFIGLIVILFFVLFVYAEMEVLDDKLEFCKSNGWEGTSPLVENCYKKINDSSGLGYSYKYSGNIKGLY